MYFDPTFAGILIHCNVSHGLTIYQERRQILSQLLGAAARLVIGTSYHLIEANLRENY